MNKPKFETPNLTAENVAKIGKLFPGVVTEGKVNIDLLRSMLGDEVYGDEAYEFTWVGKRAAIAEAGRPIRKTLRPCPEESRDWDTTENLYIEGDNLDVLKLLQESYLGKVKMIYIDPPYNTGNDFVYRDNFTQSREDYAEEAGVYDADGDRLFKNTESNGRFHSDWCSMMYPRLVLARNLLRDDGVIFISIDDNEVAQLRKICDEVFGESNFVESYVWQSTFRPDNSSPLTRKNAETILLYAKAVYNIGSLIGTTQQSDGLPSLTKNSMKVSKLSFKADVVETYLDDGVYLAGERDSGYTLLNDIEVSHGRIITDFELMGRVIWGQAYLDEQISNGTKIIIKGEGFVPYSKKPSTTSAPNKIIPSDKVADVLAGRAELTGIYDGNIIFQYPKPTSLLKYLMETIDDKDCIILDFFSGSATTAHAVMQLNAEDGGNRKFIMAQLPEVTDEKSEAFKAGYKNICEIGKERIRRAGNKIKADNADKEGIGNLDIGFRVLKLDDTNMNDVYYAAGDYTQDLILQMESNIKPDRTDMDLLYGCLLDWGLLLSMPHTHEKIDGFTVHTYNDGDLIACFEERISEKAIREIASRKPLRAVFRDSSFTSSPEKINVVEIFKLLAPNTTVRVI